MTLIIALQSFYETCVRHMQRNTTEQLPNNKKIASITSQWIPRTTLPPCQRIPTFQSALHFQRTDVAEKTLKRLSY